MGKRNKCKYTDQGGDVTLKLSTMLESSSERKVFSSFLVAQWKYFCITSKKEKPHTVYNYLTLNTFVRPA